MLYLEQKTSIANKEWVLVGSIVITQNKRNTSNAVQKLNVVK